MILAHTDLNRLSPQHSFEELPSEAEELASESEADAVELPEAAALRGGPRLTSASLRHGTRPLLTSLGDCAVCASERNLCQIVSGEAARHLMGYIRTI